MAIQARSYHPRGNGAVSSQAFGRTLLVSEFEAETFRKIAPESADRIGSLTNGVDLAYFAPAKFDNPFPEANVSIVMTGHMDYRPNYEGALWFAKDILPLVRKSVPNARAYFVGASPSPALRAAAGHDIVVTGRVVDIGPICSLRVPSWHPYALPEECKTRFWKLWPWLNRLSPQGKQRGLLGCVPVSTCGSPMILSNSQMLLFLRSKETTEKGSLLPAATMSSKIIVGRPC